MSPGLSRKRLRLGFFGGKVKEANGTHETNDVAKWNCDTHQTEAGMLVTSPINLVLIYHYPETHVMDPDGDLSLAIQRTPSLFYTGQPFRLVHRF